MTSETIREAILKIVPKYPIKRVILFGSRANGTYREKSDVDLIMEFTEAVSLLVLSEIKYCLEDILGVDVDVIHGPLRKTDMIYISEEIELYAA
ncbi:MAG: nucleotidyltransferase domain-containing protein [Lachnospiraceae bacterium]|nr:nucleotidyltransferase domain-containing protein [Lachnospiraceae bacterium]